MTRMIDHVVKVDGQEHIFRGPEDATPQEIELAVAQQFGETPAPYKNQPTDFLGVAKDVAKSAGVGAAQGLIGLATLPANVEQLGRVGIDAAAKYMGYEDPQLIKGQYLTPYQDRKEQIESVTGKFYEPQTRLGKYARTIGEFAPTGGVLGAASKGARMANAMSNILAPALVSETAGQLTEGSEYEPLARIGGALGGGLTTAAVLKTATPIINEPTRQAQINLLNKEGVKSLTAGQKTGNDRLRWFESAAQSVPGGGRRGPKLMDKQKEEFTKAALRSAGIDADRATLSVIDDAFDNLGNQFDTLASNNAIRPDTQLIDDLTSAWKDYSRVKGESARAPVVQNTIKDVVNAVQNPRNKGLFSGKAYQTLRHDLGRIQRSQAQTDPALSEAVGNIRNALDDAMERSISPQDAQQWRTIRDQYQNLLAIEKARLGAGESTALGFISPAQLRTAVKSQGKRSASRGQRDLYNLADAGEAIIKPLPSSGTSERLLARDLVNPKALASALVARVGMSRPMQNYLSNQRFANTINEFEKVRPYAPSNIPIEAVGVPNALMQFNQTYNGLRGGFGPNYETQEEIKNRLNN